MTRRRVVLAAFAAMLIALAGMGVGCSSGPSAEELIAQDIEAQLSALQDAASDLHAEFVEDLEASNGDNLSMLGIDADDYVTSLLDGFAYQVNGVSVDEDAGTATADVTVTCKPLHSIMEEFDAAAEGYAEQYVADAIAAGQTEVDEAALYQDMGQMFMDAIDGAESQESACVFTYTRNDEGAWAADESAADELATAMIGAPPVDEATDAA